MSSSEQGRTIAFCTRALACFNDQAVVCLHVMSNNGSRSASISKAFAKACSLLKLGKFEQGPT